MLCTSPLNIEMGKRVPCGRCMACRINRGQEWSVRLLHEVCRYSSSVFITLTYEDGFLPKDGGLVKAHAQNWVKRVRNRSGKLKYYLVGEYGDSRGRPHYHAIVMGDSLNYDGCWDYGFIYPGIVEWNSINYVTAYIQKKLYGQRAKEEYGGRMPPFALMSKGMGLSWLNENKDQVMLHLGVRRHGKTVKAPRYYMKKIGDEIPVDVWNNRTIIMARQLIDADPQAVLKGTEREREGRRQKDAELRWKSENENKTRKGLL